MIASLLVSRSVEVSRRLRSGQSFVTTRDCASGLSSIRAQRGFMIALATQATADVSARVEIDEWCSAFSAIGMSSHGSVRGKLFCYRRGLRKYHGRVLPGRITRQIEQKRICGSDIPGGRRHCAQSRGQFAAMALYSSVGGTEGADDEGPSDCTLGYSFVLPRKP
ncbi:hypothetical protein EOS_36885 [Caballeronia mineralivorans PML1(12)]|uniref:Uncharacterized protein n=1 Tax=Caballeronia mineralivorans PML1(12) TaxID=908627 RepID=A0A0J1CLD9_9BURK|nr:hypothetical protein EOS_36885 [Caballeronia mineralivorans PML1(12)]